MTKIALETARKDLLRHLQHGKSVRSPCGANRVRNFIMATQINFAIRELTRSYHVGLRELNLACTEIIAETPDPLLCDKEGKLAPTSVFTNPDQYEKFLKELHHATHGQTMLQRHLAIIACAKKQAARLSARPAKSQAPVTHSHLLKTSIQNKLSLIMLCTAMVVGGILFVVYYLN